MIICLDLSFSNMIKDLQADRRNQIKLNIWMIVISHLSKPQTSLKVHKGVADLELTFSIKEIPTKALTTSKCKEWVRE